MSLNIYTAIEDIPDKMRYIKCNDAFFDEDGIIGDDLEVILTVI